MIALNAGLRTSRWLPAVWLGAGIGGALALQHLLQWLPCPLCIVQRLTALALLGVLLAFPLTARGSRASGLLLGLGALAAIAGIAAGAAHLQILAAPDTASCGPGLARWVGQLGDRVPGLAWFMEGVGACENSAYAIAGIPLPAWAMGLHASSLWLAWRNR